MPILSKFIFLLKSRPVFRNIPKSAVADVRRGTLIIPKKSQEDRIILLKEHWKLDD